MGHLILSTFMMMGMAFFIGFIVAAIIRGIALVANHMEFTQNNQEELKRLKLLRKYHLSRLKTLWETQDMSVDYEMMRYSKGLDSEGKSEVESDFLNNFYEGKDNRGEKDLNHDVEYPELENYYHGYRSGVYDTRLMDKYYPSRYRIRLLEQQRHDEEQGKLKGKSISKK